MPDVTPSPAPPQRIKRSKRKLDEAKVLRLAQLGLTTAEIATQQRLNPSTVWRFLESVKANGQQIDTFKGQRADVFAGLSLEALDVQSRIIRTLDDGVLSALRPSEKTGLLMALNAVNGTIYDKERLERGQSTENHSVMHKILGAAFDGVHKPSIDKGSPDAKQ